MPSFYGPIDLLKNELRQAAVQNLASAPASPVKGQLYYDTATNIMYWWDGTTWQSTKASAATVAFGTITAEQTFGASKTDGVATTVARSDHGHGNPTHVAADHSTIPLSALALPTTGLNMNGFQIANLGTTTNASDAATKAYVDNLVAGLSWKEQVRVATTGPITLSGNQTIDSITTTDGVRVLVKDQANPVQNGIYTAFSGAWPRATDADATGELEGAAVFVMQGTVNVDTAWVCTTTTVPIVPGTTQNVWAQFAGGGTVTAGAGMTQSANTLNVIAGDTSLVVNADEVHVNPAVMATVASLAGYVPTSRQVIAGNGLITGGALTGDVTLDVGAGAGIVVVANAVAVDGAVYAAWSGIMYATTLGGNVAYATGEVVTHSLGVRDVSVVVRNGASPYQAVEVDWEATSVNTVTVRYNPVLGAGYRVLVMAKAF